MPPIRTFAVLALATSLVAGAFAAAAQQSSPPPRPQRPAATPPPAAAQQPAARPQAQPTPSDVVVRVAVIDIDGIHRNAAAAKDIRSQVEKYRRDFQAEFRKEDEALRQANQELAKQRTILSAEAFSEERRKFEVRLTEAQRLAQQERQALDRVTAQAVADMQKILDEIITKIVVDAQVTLLYRKEQLVYVNKAFDITDAVLEQLDKRLQTVKVQEPDLKSQVPAAKVPEAVVRPPLGR